MNKEIRNGKVGVLVSYGYGAGFYTWGAPAEAIFSPTLINLIENNKYEEAVQFITETWPDVYTGGVTDLSVEWVPEGAKFIINEYDGAESLELMDEMNWLIA
jgi:hypothetical protein